MTYELPGDYDPKANQTDAPMPTGFTTTHTGTDPLEDTKDYTSEDDTRFNGLPGHPEVWLDKDTGRAYIVYFTPEFEPPIPIMFAVSSTSDLESFFGDKSVVYDRKMSSDEIMSTGAIPFGSTSDIVQTEGDPWAGFLEKMERAIEVQPWLADPEVYALFAGAWLEDRPVEEWELQTTDYWQGLNEDERAWIVLNAGDPSTAMRVLQDNTMEVISRFNQLGLRDVPQQVIDMIANRWTTGAWSESYMSEQVLNVAGVGDQGGIATDEELLSLIESEGLEIGTGVLMETRVRDMYNTWLGPAFSPSDELIARWADRMRRNPEATTDELTLKLQAQRMQLYPEYTDENATYDDIAGPWRNFATQILGQTPDETDHNFVKLVRMNDIEEGGRHLRKLGVQQGNETVTAAISEALGSGSSRVRRAI